MIVIKEYANLNMIKRLAGRSGRLVYAISSCWWFIGDPPYRHRSGLPCGPRGEMLMETDKPLDFINAAEENPEFYGKRGLRTFVAAYHGNVRVAETDLPTSLKTWEEYSDLIKERDSYFKEMATRQK